MGQRNPPDPLKVSASRPSLSGQVQVRACKRHRVFCHPVALHTPEPRQGRHLQQGRGLRMEQLARISQRRWTATNPMLHHGSAKAHPVRRPERIS